MSEKESEGYQFAKGAISYLAGQSLKLVCVILAVAAIRNVAGFGIDDSDQDGWHRSGLSVHTDYKTGIQYLSDGHGGLVRRDSSSIRP